MDGKRAAAFLREQRGDEQAILQAVVEQLCAQGERITVQRVAHLAHIEPKNEHLRAIVQHWRASDKQVQERLEQGYGQVQSQGVKVTVRRLMAASAVNDKAAQVFLRAKRAEASTQKVG